MKKILIPVLAVILIAAAIFLVVFLMGNKDGKEPSAGVSENEWDAMLDSKNFENYTLTLTGEMTQSHGDTGYTSQVNETVKITKDKVLMITAAEVADPTVTEDRDVLFEGEMALAQKTQFEQIFLALLSKYESFVYDAQTKTYTVGQTVRMDIDLVSYSYDDTGVIQTRSVPSTLEMQKATVTLSEDGKLMKFVCDYTQTMKLQENVVISGLTTWTFSDYGTTVIE